MRRLLFYACAGCLVVLGIVALVLIRQHHLAPLTSAPTPPTESYVVTDAERAAWPKTVDEAVTEILSTMKDEDKQTVRETKKDDLIKFHHGWGTGIRNGFGLRRGNRELMADCHAQEPDEASMVIIEAVWETLQKP